MIVPVAVIFLLVAVSVSEADSSSKLDKSNQESVKIEKVESYGFDHDFLDQEPVIFEFTKKEPEPIIEPKIEEPVEPSPQEQINAVKSKSKADCGDCTVKIRKREYTYDPKTGYLMTDLSGEGANQ